MQGTRARFWRLHYLTRWLIIVEGRVEPEKIGDEPAVDIFKASSGFHHEGLRNIMNRWLVNWTTFESSIAPMPQ
jgi:hypothetical protein